MLLHDFLSHLERFGLPFHGKTNLAGWKSNTTGEYPAVLEKLDKCFFNRALSGTITNERAKKEAEKLESFIRSTPREKSNSPCRLERSASEETFCKLLRRTYANKNRVRKDAILSGSRFTPEWAFPSHSALFSYPPTRIAAQSSHAVPQKACRKRGHRETDNAGEFESSSKRQNTQPEDDWLAVSLIDSPKPISRSFHRRPRGYMVGSISAGNSLSTQANHTSQGRTPRIQIVLLKKMGMMIPSLSTFENQMRLKRKNNAWVLETGSP